MAGLTTWQQFGGELVEHLIVWVVEVLEVRPSKSKPDRGIARLKYHGVNQRGETVLSLVINHLLACRPGSRG